MRCALALLVLLWGATAAAEPEQVALYELRVDGVSHGAVLLVRDGGDDWLSAEALASAGVATGEGRRTIDGVLHTALSSLPQLSAEVDSAALVVRLTTRRERIPDSVALFELRVDGAPRGLVLVVQIQGDVLLSLDALEQAGVRGAGTGGGRKESLQGAPHVVLSSLAPSVRFALDPSRFVLELQTSSTPAVARVAPSDFDQVAVFLLDLNGEASGEALVMRKGQEAWIAVEELEERGLGGFAGTRDTIDGSACVRLSSLEPSIAFQVDTVGQRLVVSASPDVFTGRDLVAVLDLTVNDEPRGETRALLRGSEVRVPVAALERAGLRHFQGARVTVDGESWVALSSLSPGIAHSVDDGGLLVKLTARPEFFAPNALDLASTGRPRDIVYARNASAFVNYAATGRQTGEVDAFGETGVSVKGSLLTSMFSRVGEGPVARNATTLTLDDRKRLLRWTAGDRFAASGPLGGGVLLGGLGVSREYAIDPYFIHSPTIDMTGAASTPSTVEVYVNDRLVRREQVPAGTFDLQNLALQNGQGEARLVIRDAFGREREVKTSYYSSSGLLDRGRHDYSYAVGLVRAPPRAPRSATEKPRAFDLGEYGEPAFLGGHRVGLTRWMSAAARMEATRELASGGTSLGAALPVGQFDLAVAGSVDRGESGSAASLAYGYTRGRFSFDTAARVTSPRYATVSLRAEAERNVVDLRGSVRMRVGSSGSVSLQHTIAENRVRERTERSAAFGSLSVLRRSHLFVSASHTRRTSAADVVDVFGGMSVDLGARTNASVSHQQQGISGTSDAGLQKALPEGTGIGYRVAMREQAVTPRTGDPPQPSPQSLFGPGRGPQSASGVLQYQNPYGRWELAGGATPDGQSGSLHVAGGLVALGGGVYASRPIEQGYALVQVPGVRGVRVQSSNRTVGRTNRRGNLLVPNMLSYYGNQLSIADEDVPIDYSVRETSRTVAPGHRGAAVVSFEVRKILAITGTAMLQVDGRMVIPEWGEMTVRVGAETSTSPIGKSGEFYFENLPAGTHRATVRWRGRTGTAVLVVPAKSAQPVVDIGAVTAGAR